MESPTIDDQKSHYDYNWSKSSKLPYLRQHLKNRIFGITRIFEKLELHEPQILEIGCGVGHLAGRLSKFGSVDAIDLSSEAAAKAKTMYPQVNFYSGNVLVQDFDFSVYDIIVTSEVIEHINIDDRDRFVHKIWKSLKPNGFLILTTPNKNLSDKLTNRQPIENHFTESELKDLVSQYFEIKHLSTTHNFYPLLCYRSRFLQIIRLILYEVLQLRMMFEDPFKNRTNGTFFVLLGQRREMPLKSQSDTPFTFELKLG